LTQCSSIRNAPVYEYKVGSVAADEVRPIDTPGVSTAIVALAQYLGAHLLPEELPERINVLAAAGCIFEARWRGGATYQGLDEGDLP
jgi:hypothetical protein